MVNNTDTIRRLLKFPNSSSFYFLEIIKRRKENPEMERHQKLIKDYYIYSLKDFDKLLPSVIELCNEHNARAYFRLNLRDAEKIALQYNLRLAELLITKDYKNIPRSYAAVVGEFQHEAKGDNTWIIDLDHDENRDQVELDLKVIEVTSKVETCGGRVVAQIPTLNGIHLITSPFRRDWFGWKFPDIDVHKDNPTVLYAA